MNYTGRSSAGPWRVFVVKTAAGTAPGGLPGHLRSLGGSAKSLGMMVSHVRRGAPTARFGIRGARPRFFVGAGFQPVGAGFPMWVRVFQLALAFDKMKSCRHKRRGCELSPVGASFQLAHAFDTMEIVSPQREVGASFPIPCGCEFPTCTCLRHDGSRVATKRERGSRKREGGPSAFCGCTFSPDGVRPARAGNRPTDSAEEPGRQPAGRLNAVACRAGHRNRGRVGKHPRRRHHWPPPPCPR